MKATQFTPTQERLINLLRSPVSRQELADGLGVSVDVAASYLSRLARLVTIIKSGRYGKTRYVLADAALSVCPECGQLTGGRS